MDREITCAVGRVRRNRTLKKELFPLRQSICLKITEYTDTVYDNCIFMYI
jgi:hypothetical protein